MTDSTATKGIYRIQNFILLKEPEVIISNKMIMFIFRAHQNTLEGFPTYLMLLLIGGLEMPVLSALAGVVFIAGRVSYAKGYYTGEPKNR